VASGPNSALPHYRAGDRRLASGDLVVLDFGGVLDGYCSDLTPHRVDRASLTRGPSTYYAALYDAQKAAIRGRSSGVETSAIDAAARNVWSIAASAMPSDHGTGHGLGLRIHEDPKITRVRPDVPSVPLEAGDGVHDRSLARIFPGSVACGSKTMCWLPKTAARC
jgi:Xaa-Pro aminopeptidase